MTSLARDEALVREALEGPRSEEMRYGSHVTQARVSITVADLREALAALARIVGQAEQLRELVSDLAAALRPSTGHHVECQAERHTGSKNCNCGFERNRVLLERVAALAGVTDNERTAEEPWCAAEGCQELPVGYDAESDEHYCAKHKEPWG